MNEDVDTEIIRRIRFLMWELSLGVPPVKAVHFFRAHLKELSQQGAISLEEMTEYRAVLGKWTEEYRDGWAKGYAEGWAAAVLRVLEQRDVPFSDKTHGYISTRTDLKALADWLDRAATVSHGKELLPTNPRDVG